MTNNIAEVQRRPSKSRVLAGEGGLLYICTAMTNLMIPFECPICGSDGFRQVQVRGRDGLVQMTQAYECTGCSTMFRERERFTKHRLQVIGADGTDLKPRPAANKHSGG